MSDKIESYRDRVVWQQAMDLTVAVYRVSRKWPREELYGLTSQARRAATSVPANIAEGYGRDNTGSYQQFLRIAQGSLKELETHLLVAERIGIAPADSGARPASGSRQHRTNASTAHPKTHPKLR